MKTRHLIDLDSLSLSEIGDILHMAEAIAKKPSYYSDSCHGMLMATAFYEPSTRTQMSFQAAMLRLGGKVIGFDSPDGTSVSKGESLKDTVRVLSGYADIITIRHPLEGAAKAASMYSAAPVINAGDGGHLHPTQTLTDIFTLLREKGTLENLTIGLCGDLKHGRTVHSLIKAISRYKGNRFVLISTPELALPAYLKAVITENGLEYEEKDSLADALSMIDVLYMTRIQRERFAGHEDYEKQKGIFILDTEKLYNAKYGLKILHPLPRVDEIEDEVDDDPRAVYFNQAEYGMYARMALILHMLDGETKHIDPRPEGDGERVCSNPKCVTGAETYLPKLFRRKGGKFICEYCDKMK